MSALLILATAYCVFAQSGTAPRFDVASIKPAMSAPLRHIVRPLPGGLHVENASIRLLMQNAYGLQPFQITGGPAWIDSASYDIEAKAEGSATQRQVFLMLQSILEDRFKLKVHRETKELPAYALTAAKSGFKLPAPTEGSCVPSPDGPSSYAAGTRIAPPGAGPAPVTPCGNVKVVLLPSGARLLGGKVLMPEFVRVLSMALGSPVIDKTGFTQLFDVRLDFLADEITAALPPPPLPPDNPSNPSILIALQEQLGLKLESTKSPVEVIDIDHVERPVEN